MKLFIFLFLFSTILSKEKIVIIKDERVGEGFLYFKELLTESLNRTIDEYGKFELVQHPTSMSQGRSIEEVRAGNIDVIWTGADIAREKILLPIRIPLLGGLLGYRVPVIRKKDYDYFKDVYRKEDLMPLIAIQGTHWPDSEILRQNNLRLVTVSDFKNMYPMLEYKRVDYFPRQIISVYSEVEHYNSDKLMILDELILHYPFFIYFFVSNDNETLAERIEKGLMSMVEDGSFMDFITSHPTTREVFPLTRYKNSRFIYLENNNISPETPFDNKKLWIDFK